MTGNDFSEYRKVTKFSSYRKILSAPVEFFLLKKLTVRNYSRIALKRTRYKADSGRFESHKIDCLQAKLS